jgi:predicted nucleic acid-binding protein
VAQQLLWQLQSRQFPIIPLSDRLFTEALLLYGRQKAPHITLAMCANVAIMREYLIPKIASFDTHYKQLGVQVEQPG